MIETNMASDVQQLSFVYVIYTCYLAFFIYIRPLVFPFEWFYTSNFGALYSLLFGVSQGSVEGLTLTYNLFTFINCYLDGELSQ